MHIINAMKQSKSIRPRRVRERVQSLVVVKASLFYDFSSPKQNLRVCQTDRRILWNELKGRRNPYDKFYSLLNKQITLFNIDLMMSMAKMKRFGLFLSLIYSVVFVVLFSSHPQFHYFRKTKCF